MGEKFKHPFITAIILFDIMVLFLLPVLLIIMTSFSANRTVVFPPKGFTFRWYKEVFVDPLYRNAIFHSLVAATIDATLSVPLGVLAALGVNKYTIKLRSFLQSYLLLPFIIPLVVSAMILMIIYTKLGLIGQLWAVGLAILTVDISFMIATVSSAVNALDRNLEYAAQNLGANEIQTFFSITIPLLKPGIISGFLLMWLLGFNEFLVSLMVTNRATITLPVAMYTVIRSNITTEVAAAASIVIIVSWLLILTVDRLVGLEGLLGGR